MAKTKKLDIDTKTATELNRLRQVERAYALLKEEHYAFKKSHPVLFGTKAEVFESHLTDTEGSTE